MSQDLKGGAHFPNKDLSLSRKTENSQFSSKCPSSVRLMYLIHLD